MFFFHCFWTIRLFLLAYIIWPVIAMSTVKTFRHVLDNELWTVSIFIHGIPVTDFLYV